MKKKKILLTNSFAVNNGDLALVVALYQALTKLGYSVSIATFHYNFLSKRYPDLPFIRELLDYPFLNKLSFLKALFLRIHFALNSNYRDHDLFIACPGGYINSYYGIKRCLLPLVQAKRYGKRTAIYSQSIGPLNSRDTSLLARFSNHIDIIVARDAFSVKCLQGVPHRSVIMTSKDAAFLLKPRLKNVSSIQRRVAVSVRRWEYDSRDMNSYQKLIHALCKQCLLADYHIEFISTCQGVPNYRDDSFEAQAIANAFIQEMPQWADRISIDTSYHTFQELSNLLHMRYAFTIGTRLHMCILSMLNGTPAFNISYEKKGIECFSYLEIPQYSIDFNEPAKTALAKLTSFISNLPNFNQQLGSRLEKVHDASQVFLEQFLQVLDS